MSLLQHVPPSSTQQDNSVWVITAENNAGEFNAQAQDVINALGLHLAVHVDPT